MTVLLPPEVTATVADGCTYDVVTTADAFKVTVKKDGETVKEYSLSYSVIGENLTVNPGFEDGANGWNRFSGGVGTSASRSGINAMHFAGKLGLYQTINGVNPNWYYLTSGWAGGAGGAEANIYYMTSNDLKTVGDLKEELIREHIDILIDYNFDDDAIESYPLFKETILLCVPKHIGVNSETAACVLTGKDIQKYKHLKNSANKISIKHFKDEKFLMLKSGNSMNYYGFKICNEAGFVPNTSIYFDQLMTSYNMSASGLGICFVTDTLVKEVAANDNLLYYKIDSDFAERTVYLLRKKKRYLNRAVKEFIDVALCVYGELKNLP